MSFPENINLKHQIKQIQEQNDQLRKILEKYGSINQNFSMPNLPGMDQIPNFKGIDMIPNFGRNTVGIPNFGRNTVGVRRPRGIDMIPNFGRYVIESAEQNQNFSMFDKINSGELDADVAASWMFPDKSSSTIEETLRNYLKNQEHENLQIGLDVYTHMKETSGTIRADLMLDPHMVEHVMKDPRRINHLIYSGVPGMMLYPGWVPPGYKPKIFENFGYVLKRTSAAIADSATSDRAREAYISLLHTITSHPKFEKAVKRLDTEDQDRDDEGRVIPYFNEADRIDVIDSALKTGHPEVIKKITSGINHTIKYPVESTPGFSYDLDPLDKSWLKQHQRRITDVILNAAQSNHEAAVKYAVGHPIFHSVIMDMMAKDPKMIETLHPIAQNAVRLKGRPGKTISFKNKEI